VSCTKKTNKLKKKKKEELDFTTELARNPEFLADTESMECLEHYVFLRAASWV